jgi:mRNA-degrading endonuclease RelE of RelBE toxin-antitoxin system
MEFVETSVFTKALHALLSDDEYRQLQNLLWRDPLAGDLVKGGGGIRKIRFGIEGRGKSGGVRVIYYWIPPDEEIYMLLIYPKSKKDSLSAEETAVLRALVKELSNG